MLSIAHIVNPFRPSEGSDIVKAQPVTFATMELARELAADRVRVTQLSAQYAEDRAIVPDWMHPTRDLERSVLDVGSFDRPRRLPLLADILERLDEAGDHELAVFTNVDIALMPTFYLLVQRLHERGFDAMVINRRTIRAGYELDDLPLMLADPGKPHPGHDCFVFRMDRLEELDLGEVCVGINWVGRALLWNVVATSESFRLYPRLHATFHLGEERSWRDPAFADYHAHNEREALAVLERLIARRPELTAPDSVFMRHVRDLELEV